MTPGAVGSQRRAVLLVLGAVASVQLGGAFAAQLIPVIGVVGSVALRLTLAAAVLLAVSRPRVRGRSRTDWAAVGAYAAALGLMNLFFYASLERLPIGVAVTIEFVGPLLLAAATSRRRADLLAVMAAAGGVLLVSGALTSVGRSIDLAGVAFALAAGACWAAYIVTGGRVGARLDGLDGLALALALATVVTLPAGLATAGTDLLRLDVLALGAGIALLSSLLPYSMELVALRTLPPNVFGVLLSLEPAAAALAGLVVLSQTLEPVRLAGMGLVITASALVLGARRRRPRDPGLAVPES